MDKAHERVRGTHFGGPYLISNEPPGSATAGAIIIDWLFNLRG